MPVKPYGVRGTVKLNTNAGVATAYQGALVWGILLDKYPKQGSRDSIHFMRTNASGQYVLDIKNVIGGSGSYANGDTIRIYCALRNGIKDWKDVKVNTAVGTDTVNFTFARKSGLTDGLKDSTEATGKKGWNNIRGTIPGLKDGCK